MRTRPRRMAAILTGAAAAVMIFELAIPEPAEARGARARAASSMARSGGFSRPAPSPSRDFSASRDFDRQARDVNRDINRDLARDFDGDIDRTFDRDIDRELDREFDRDIDRDIRIDEDIDIDVDHGWDDDWGDHPVATGVAFGTAAAVTSAAVGSWVYALPPSCAYSPYYGYSYYHCGGVWYEPQYSGTQVTYVVVEEPTSAGGGYPEEPDCDDPNADPYDPRCANDVSDPP